MANTATSLNLGAAIERYLAAPPAMQGDGITGHPYRLGFTDFLKQQLHITDDLPLRQALKMKPGAYKNWNNPDSDIRRETLEGLSAAHHLTPAQEMGLWSIARGNLLLPSAQAIAATLTEDNAARFKAIPNLKKRGNLRVETIDALCQRTGFSLDKLREAAVVYAKEEGMDYTYSKALNLTLTSANHEFHNIRTAQHLARVFAPDDLQTANNIGLMLLGFSQRYSPHQLAGMLASGEPPKHEVLALARQQRFQTVEQAYRFLGVSEGAYTRWEERPTDISDAEYADACALYLCDSRVNKDTPMSEQEQAAIRATADYDSITHHLMGDLYKPYQVDVALIAPPAPDVTQITTAAPLPQTTAITHEGVVAAINPNLTLGHWLNAQTASRPRENFYETLSLDTGRTMGKPIAIERLHELLHDSGAPPSMIEQVALVSALGLNTADKTIFEALCKKAAGKSGGDDLPTR